MYRELELTVAPYAQQAPAVEQLIALAEKPVVVGRIFPEAQLKILDLLIGEVRYGGYLKPEDNNKPILDYVTEETGLSQDSARARISSLSKVDAIEIVKKSITAKSHNIVNLGIKSYGVRLHAAINEKFRDEISLQESSYEAPVEEKTAELVMHELNHMKSIVGEPVIQFDFSQMSVRQLDQIIKRMRGSMDCLEARIA